MPNIKMRVLATMPQSIRNRLAYRTRMMMADDDQFEVGGSDARLLLKAKWAVASGAPAEPAPVPVPAPRPRGRPPKVREPEPEPEPEPWAEPEPDPWAEPDEPAKPYLENMTVGELRALAEQRGIDLPSHYLKRDELIDRLEAGA